MKRPSDRWRRLRKAEGQSLVEFALASILFFTVVFGTIEFGLAVWQYNMMSDLAQSGARWASVHGLTSATPATAAQLQTFVQSRTGFTVTVTATPANPSAVAPGNVIQVRVASTFSPVTALIPSTVLNLQSTARMIVSR